MSSRLNMEMVTPKWLNEKQVAEITGRAVQTLRNDRAKRQGIPYYKDGRSVRYRADCVVSYMESRKVNF